MPVRIPDNLPARLVLETENIFVMTYERAIHQDIRPLRIAVLNLMPTKIVTETQLLRLLGNTALQVDVRFIRMASHDSKNTPQEHLETFYETTDEILGERFDGLVITGAPVETLPFEEVDYWEELVRIMDWSVTNVWSTLHICWGAQAGLYHHFGIPKYAVPEKVFGIFKHRLLEPFEPLVRGFDEEFYAPQSRHTEIREADVASHPLLKILATSDESGLYLISSRDRRMIFVIGHPEYDRLTLKAEYDRDRERGLPIKIPRHYFPDDDPGRTPIMNWRAHAHLLYANWLNYCVYQETPYDLVELTPAERGHIPVETSLVSASPMPR
ncbi:MAG TPA: homoserine O-succinyltransferase [Termitinemataceae bacterium]|nr:homoserine O-succinyltransferase [Termitinemataceae bacterium]HOM23514.1 homoserine O-succinyltransferase [Termitinemataceae bacterium]HPP99695.1 homoserine O-succinyltransferase [Termitinemataceae bacterium]